MSKVKKALAVLGALLGLATAHEIGSADLIAKAQKALSAGEAAVEVLAPSEAPAQP